MNTMIIYSSRYGCTADCANYLKEGLSGTAALIDIENTDSKNIEMTGYDTVILGSSIYVGAVSKKLRIFCKENETTLNKKRVGIFLCCAFSEQATEYISKNFPPSLVEHAAAIQTFGSDARTEKMRVIDKLIMKAATKGREEVLKISYESMDSFIRVLNTEAH